MCGTVWEEGELASGEVEGGRGEGEGEERGPSGGATGAAGGVGRWAYGELVHGSVRLDSCCGERRRGRGREQDEVAVDFNSEISPSRARASEGGCQRDDGGTLITRP